MRDRSDRYRVESVPSLVKQKRLGSYLIDAGLLTKDQIDVALNDQQITGMRFGDILVARGWIKEQTIEWIVDKVIEPEKRALLNQRQGRKISQSTAAQSTTAQSTTAQSTTAQSTTTQSTTAQSTTKLSSSLTPANPDNRVARPLPAKLSQEPKSAPSSTSMDSSSFGRRDLPISKPLPSVGQTDGDVQWVG